MSTLVSLALIHHEWWTLAPGQLAKGESVHIGCHTHEDAMAVALKLKPEYTWVILELDTIENPKPTDSTEWNAADNVTSKRWCVVVTHVGPILD